MRWKEELFSGYKVDKLFRLHEIDITVVSYCKMFRRSIFCNLSRREPRSFNKNYKIST